MSDTMKFKKGKMISFRTHLQSEPMYYFGYDIVEELGPLLKQHEHDKVFLVTNDVFDESVRTGNRGCPGP